MPLFHGNALMALWGPAVMVGAAIAVRPRFSTSAFLDDVRRFGATKFSYVGKAIAYILATPERPDDADNTLKSAFGTEASVRDRDRFRRAFRLLPHRGLRSERGGAAINPVLGMPKGALGKPVGDVDLAVISPETGGVPACRVRRRRAAAQRRPAIGEIVNRSGRGKFEGYYRREDAEEDRLRERLVLDRGPRVRRRRRLLLLRGPHGRLAPGRLGELRGGPSRRCCRAIPTSRSWRSTPSPTRRRAPATRSWWRSRSAPGRTFDPDAFADWLEAQPDLGPKWVPRYVRVSESLPQTATGKVTKVGLRAEAWATDEPVWWRPLGSSELRFDASRATTTGPCWTPAWSPTDVRLSVVTAVTRLASPSSSSTRRQLSRPVWSPGSSGGAGAPPPFLRHATRGRRPCRPRGPRTSGSHESPTKSPSLGRRPERRRHGVNGGMGLRAPARADVTAASTRSSSPTCSRKPSSSQPQFEQTPTEPAPAKGPTASPRPRDRRPSPPGPTARKASIDADPRRASHPARPSQLPQAAPDPCLVGLLVDRVLPMFDPVVVA